MAARGDCRRAGQDSEPEPKPEPEPRPEPGLQAGLESGEEFEIVDRSQLPSPGELRSASRTRAAESWSAPILTLARRATGNLSASCGSALRAAAGLGDGGGGGGERAGRPGSRGLGLLHRCRNLTRRTKSTAVLCRAAQGSAIGVTQREKRGTGRLRAGTPLPPCVCLCEPQNCRVVITD